VFAKNSFEKNSYKIANFEERSWGLLSADPIVETVAE